MYFNLIFGIAILWEEKYLRNFRAKDACLIVQTNMKTAFVIRDRSTRRMNLKTACLLKIGNAMYRVSVLFTSKREFLSMVGRGELFIRYFWLPWNPIKRDIDGWTRSGHSILPITQKHANFFIIRDRSKRIFFHSIYLRCWNLCFSRGSRTNVFQFIKNAMNEMDVGNVQK